MLDLLAIIRDALLHPTQLLLRMHQQQYRYRQVLLAMALWLGFWWLVIGASTTFFVQNFSQTILFGPILVTLLISMVSSMAIPFGMSNSFRYKIADGLYLIEPVFVQNSYYLFWPIRIQIAWFPVFFY